MEKKFVVATNIALADAAGKLAKQTEDYAVAKPFVRRGEWYFAQISYKDVGRFVQVDVWLEQTEAGKILLLSAGSLNNSKTRGEFLLFHILSRYQDGRGERHLLNSVANSLERVILVA